MGPGPEAAQSVEAPATAHLTAASPARSIQPTPSTEPMPLPNPSPELHRAMQLADFANAASMLALQFELTAYARTLRAADASQVMVTSTVRALVDESLPRRVVPIRTSEDRNRLLALAAEWSGGSGM